jgi:hypothetical protein
MFTLSKQLIWLPIIPLKEYLHLDSLRSVPHFEGKDLVIKAGMIVLNIQNLGFSAHCHPLSLENEVDSFRKGVLKHYLALGGDHISHHESGFLPLQTRL